MYRALLTIRPKVAVTLTLDSMLVHQSFTRVFDSVNGVRLADCVVTMIIIMIQAYKIVVPL